MTAILKSQPLLRQRTVLLPRLTCLSRRLTHDSHQVEQPAEVTSRRWGHGYREIAFPGLAKREICLWDAGTRLGVKPMPEVMSKFLGPGKMLSWRRPDDAPTKPSSSSQADGADDGADDGKGTKSNKHTKRGKLAKFVPDYEIIDIAREGAKFPLAFRTALRDKGMLDVVLRANSRLPASSTHIQLIRAYQILADPAHGARYPVRFHIIPPAKFSDQRRTSWAIKNRADLHPEVIMRAMPEGVEIRMAPQIDKVGWNVVWSYAAAHYGYRLSWPKAGPERGAGEEPGPHEGRTAGAALGKQRLTEAGADTPELRERIEATVAAAMGKQAVIISGNYEKELSKAVAKRRSKDPNSPATPSPEEAARVQEKIRTVIKRAMPNIRAAIMRQFGVEPGTEPEPEPEAAVKDVDGGVDQEAVAVSALRAAEEELSACLKPYYVGQERRWALKRERILSHGSGIEEC